MSIVAGIIGALAKWFLGLWLKTTPAPSAEAVATGQAMAAHIDAAVSKSSATVATAEAQAIVDAPTDKAGVVDALDKGAF